MATLWLHLLLWVVGAILTVALYWWGTERVWEFAVEKGILRDNWYNGCLKVLLKIIVAGLAISAWGALWGELRFMF